MPSTNRYLALLITYLKPQWRRVLVLLVLLLATIGLQLANPQILRWFIDTATSGGITQTLLLIALIFLIVAIGGQLISIGETYVAENVGLIATNKLRADLMLHCLHLDPTFHAAHTPGELIERVDGDVSLLSNFFSRFIVAILGNGLLLIGVLALLFGVDWRVGMALTLFVVIAMLQVTRMRNIAAPAWQRSRQAEAELFGFIEERLSGTEDIRASGATLYSVRGLQQHTRTVLRAMQHAALLGSISWTSILFFVAVGSAIGLALGVYLFYSRGISLGTVYLIFAYTTLLNRPIEQIARQIEDMQKATAGIARIRNLLDERSVLMNNAQEAVLPPGAFSVALDDVSFSYTEDVPVLKHITLSLESGSVLGLLGKTGSGKTTITKLLTRLYDPTTGSVCLGGLDLRTARLADVRQHVGVVTQDVQLFHASIRDNLTFFERDSTDERIVQVLEDLGLAEWYRALPEGLDTRLAPGGSGLSAGEAQLLAFARVFLKDPGLVILDEASSRLDLATERRLEQAIDRLLQGHTCIIIAHRLATVQRADYIMILEHGECCEYGGRLALAADPTTRFAQLLRTGLEEVLA